ncbi:phage portal protein, HK97 family [Segniliparus rotundus DSM 44985]|uniref:Phage portal protein, HK97 family n=1 Tax=Segniliparus rotundus (strain ATCC BAA-972 / CDC 1076 / CIP 108378 / DSM 44985 / JCM 13578) TaxID=640132 RepID=D6ZFB4_SEGRD|nr:phage portal protein [Segniliparus rotundus]ADG97638.1 phage portal protein, HK97 family [Segniliparus rotundus DSM 44985]
MGLLSWLGFKPPAQPPAVWTAAEPVVRVVLADLQAQPVEKLWAEQPNLRTVIDFLARNVAQLGLHAYSRQPNGGRERERNTALARLLERPNPEQTCYELLYSLVADLSLYDQAFWYVDQDPASESGWVVRPIPPAWVTGRRQITPFAVAEWQIAPPHATGLVVIPGEKMLVFHGWNPLDPTGGLTPVATLKAVLAEQIAAQAYRLQTWRNGGRVGAYIHRPADAPRWSPEAKHRFVTDYQGAYSGNNGPRAGGTPVLEDGMELRRIGFSAKDEDYIEAQKLALATVASVYHISPVMVGLLDNANYSNVEAFSRMLYTDTLGPTLSMVAGRLNAFLVPRIAPGSASYVEFDLREKLKGSFEQEAQATATAVGGPWLTVNEARAKDNLPAVEGGDELLRNLNQTTEPSPPPPLGPHEEGAGDAAQSVRHDYPAAA